MPCVLVSCCGLPAAGKTTFCRSVANCTAVPVGISSAAGESSTNTINSPIRTKLLLVPSSDVSKAVTTGLSSRARGGAIIRVSHICFDDHIDRASRRRCRIPPLERHPLAGAGIHHLAGDTPGKEEDKERNGENDKGCRKIGALEGLCSRSNGGSSAEAQEPQEHTGLSEGKEGAGWWHEGRRDALAEIEALAAAPTSAVDASSVPSQATSVASPARGRGNSRQDASIHVVLADDNMHFRSMRHEVLRIARAHGCGYAQIYFPTDPEVAIQRNRIRGTPIDEAVIRKMSESFQPPNPERFKWERHTVVMEPPDLDTNREGAFVVGGQDTHPSRQNREPSRPKDVGGEAWESALASWLFWQVIIAAAEDLVPPLPVSTALSREQVDDRETTRTSSLHQLDLELRESAKRVANQATSTCHSREAVRSVMRVCSEARKVAMRRARVTHQHTRTESGCAGGMDTDTDINPADGADASYKAREDQRGEKTPFIVLNPMEEFAREFERALSRIDGLEASVRWELVEAARGRR